MDLASVAERVSAIERSKARLHDQRCLHAFGKFATCQACAQVCPAGAFTPGQAAGQPPTLEAEKCTACLACLPTCPAGALDADDAVPALLTCVARVEAPVVELVCQRHPRPEAGVPVAGAPEANAAIRVRGCLAGLGAAAYAALFALGVERVLARADACAECEWARLGPEVQRQVAAAQGLLARWGLDSSLVRVAELPASAPPARRGAEVRPLWEAENPPLSRRDMFRLASRRGQVMLARAMTTDTPIEAQMVPRERRRLGSALDQIAARNPQPIGAGQLGPGFGTVTVGAECTACGACVRICPTGALRLEAAPSGPAAAIPEDSAERPSFRLTFTPQACIGCGGCQTACLQGALRVDPEPAFEAVFGAGGAPLGPVELLAGELVRCARCRTWMAARPGARLCPTCEFRRKNPFGARPIPAHQPPPTRQTRQAGS